MIICCEKHYSRVEIHSSLNIEAKLAARNISKEKYQIVKDKIYSPMPTYELN